MKCKCKECYKKCKPKYKRYGMYFCSDKCVKDYMYLCEMKTCCVCGKPLMDSIFIDCDHEVYCSFECALKNWGFEPLEAQADNDGGK